jgi:predicted nucleic acid-binding protein
MICSDTSSFVALFQGERGRDVDLLTEAIRDHMVCVSPISVSELLSDADILPQFEDLVLKTPLLEITPGYWARAGKLRAKLMRRGYRPKMADTLIAQSCLDCQTPLITRDRDFEAFEKLAGLRLLS